MITLQLNRLRPAIDELVSSLESGIERMEPLHKGVTGAIRLFFKDGTSGIFKSHDTWPNEVMAYEASEAMRMHLVPPTVEVSIGGERGSLQRWVEDADEGADYRATQRMKRDDWDKLQVFDWMIGNTDRHGSNYLISQDGAVYAIDNGYSLLAGMQRPSAFQFEIFAMEGMVQWVLFLLKRTDKARLPRPARGMMEKVEELCHSWMESDEHLLGLS